MFTLACLPYEALSNLDAIARTMWRMLITHRRLLEWNTSADVNRNDSADLAATARSMWVGPVLAAAIAIDLSVSRPAALGLAAPILSLWFIFPLIAWWISRSPVRREARLTTEQITFLRNISRKTWAFFETFVSAEDNWLPPDNYQEQPVAALAHRTSPTNIGLALLANLSAYDFGYISAGQLIERTRSTFHTMEKLERSRGHFYNWYDTQSLHPLLPIFISTVDSGNLAGDLLTLRQGLLAIVDEKILGVRSFDGLEDTSQIVLDCVRGAIPAQFARFQSLLSSAQNSPPATLSAARLCIEGLEFYARETAASFHGTSDQQTAWWASALARQCRDALDELILFALEAPPGGPDEIPTLREVASIEAETLASCRARERIAVLEALALKSNELATMDYDFLFDKVRHLLSLGYHVGERRLDAGCYDLLASEARLCSFVAIAQGQVPQENWFALGRQLISTGGGPTLLSWSGSMFEYLMPLLVMPTYENTLLDQTCKAAVDRQIEYGNERGVPWGISESGYNTIDANLNYQYRAFGAPDLGLKRGLAEDLVIAPYATALALMVAPGAACLNLQRLAAEGFEGKYGFFEAIDYTPSRLPRGQTSVFGAERTLNVLATSSATDALAARLQSARFGEAGHSSGLVGRADGVARDHERCASAAPSPA